RWQPAVMIPHRLSSTHRIEQAHGLRYLAGFDQRRLGVFDMLDLPMLVACVDRARGILDATLVHQPREAGSLFRAPTETDVGQADYGVGISALPLHGALDEHLVHRF